MPSKRKNKPRKSKSTLKTSTLVLYLAILLICAGLIWFIGTKRVSPKKDATASQAVKTTFDLNSLLNTVGKKLGVPQDKIKQKKGSTPIKISIPIDKTRMDLTFANMIIKGEFEKSGAGMISGKAEKGKQILDFQSGTDSYEITLSYAVPGVEGENQQKLISIVVDDFGTVGGDLLQGFMELPKEVNFAIFPQMKNSVSTMEEANRQGRLTLVHVPMQPLDYPRMDPGGNPILIQMTESEVDKTISRALNEMPLCIGINNHMGSLATTDPDIMDYVMKVLKKRGKIFLDSRTSIVSIAYQSAQKAHVHAYRNDMFLDSPDISAGNLEKKIEQVKALGASKMNVLVITHCHSKEKLEYLKTFINRIIGEGFKIVSLTDLDKHNTPMLL